MSVRMFSATNKRKPYLKCFKQLGNILVSTMRGIEVEWFLGYSAHQQIIKYTILSVFSYPTVLDIQILSSDYLLWLLQNGFTNFSIIIRYNKLYLHACFLKSRPTDFPWSPLRHWTTYFSGQNLITKPHKNQRTDPIPIGVLVQSEIYFCHWGPVKYTFRKSVRSWIVLRSYLKGWRGRPWNKRGRETEVAQAAHLAESPFSNPPFPYSLFHWSLLFLVCIHAFYVSFLLL